MSVAPKLRPEQHEGQPSQPNAQDEAESREQQVQERRPLNALVVLEVIRREGVEELQRPVSALAFSALAAGLSMGFSLMAEGLLRSMLPDSSWRPLVAKLGYSIGFLIVVLGRQQLFTENTLTPILQLLTDRDRKTLISVLRLWAVVLTMNLAGALLFAWVVGHTSIFKPDVKHAFHDIGLEAIAGTFGGHFMRGIFAGWLIALMVWLLPSADQTRLQTIIIITYLVGLGGLSHIIAGSVETSYVVMTGATSWSQYWLTFMIPTLIGNMIGGTTLVAALNYGQVAQQESG